MILTDFVNLLKSIDPNISKNKGNGEANYTTWRVGAPQSKIMSDDQSEDEVKRVYVDRFTKTDADTIPEQISSALDDNFIPFDLVIDDDPEKNDHHFSFTCYVG